MKLIRFGEKNNEKPGIILNGSRFDVSSYFEDFNANFFNNNGLTKLKEIIQKKSTNLKEVDKNSRWASCVPKPSKVICVALNYVDHVKEMGRELLDEPTIFFKSPSSVCGPYDPIIIPKTSQKTDYEAELAVLIGKESNYLSSPEEALGVIAGYMAAIDVSERAFQIERGGLWCKGKSADSFCPLGPWLLTSDEMPINYNLNVRLSVNKEVRQNDNTDLMIRRPEVLVHYISQFMTLEVGDVILTGTPKGVGKGMNPECYLKEGDEVIFEIDLLGQQIKNCIRFENL
ncbi:MAG: fumarylacetoacetate hydrolase family protein [Solirubrobacteraceae bacterium]